MLFLGEKELCFASPLAPLLRRHAPPPGEGKASDVHHESMDSSETASEFRHRKLQYALGLRQRMTTAEEILWSALRRRQINGCKFRRQVPLGRFIVDFLCVEQCLIIEVDGSVHESQRAYDAERERELELHGYRILRFSNDEVCLNLSGVIDTIRKTLTSPLPGGRTARGRGVGGEVINGCPSTLPGSSALSC